MSDDGLCAARMDGAVHTNGGAVAKKPAKCFFLVGHLR